MSARIHSAPERTSEANVLVAPTDRAFARGRRTVVGDESGVLTARDIGGFMDRTTGIVLGTALLLGCSSGGGPGGSSAPEATSDAGELGAREGSGGQGGGTKPDAASGGASQGQPAQNALGDSSVSLDGRVMRATITARDVAPGQEEHICVVVHLPNDEPVRINDVHATLTEGSHHLIVDRRSAGTAEQPSPEICPPTMGDTSRLIIAQQKDTRVTLPEPAVYALEAKQPVFLQLHYINTATETLDIAGEVELTLAEPSADLVEVSSMFTGSFSINLAPMSEGSAQSFIPVEPAAGTRHVFALTSHMHSLGVRATIERVDSADAPPAEPLHESLDWSEPPLTTFQTPLLFDGSDGLRLRCEYQNTTDHEVHFGTKFEDEMCFMWIYYYDL